MLAVHPHSRITDAEQKFLTSLLASCQIGPVRTKLSLPVKWGVMSHLIKTMQLLEPGVIGLKMLSHKSDEMTL